MAVGLDTDRAAEGSAARRNAGFSTLRKRVRDAGLMEAQPWYYAGMFALVMGLLAIGMAVLFTTNQPWLLVLDAVFLSLVSAQIAFLGHDIGHREVFRSRLLETVAGLFLGNLLMGVSRAWWNRNHNAHHSQPNDVDHDPAVDIEILAFTQNQALAKRGLARFIVRYQHLLIIPLSSLEMINLHQQSVAMIFGRGPVSLRRTEGALLALHFIGYCSLFIVLLGPLPGLLFIAIHKAVTGMYMTMVFAPNHKGMPVLESGESLDFLHRQVLTARNVRGGLLVDFLFGGLNYQIEHHLFPAMPRNRLRAAQPIVKAFCAEQRIAYYETGVVQSYREILQSFRDAARVLG